LSNLKVEICGIEFKNPIIAASGTYGFGKEYSKFYDISILGGISTKGLTLEKREGNFSPRIAETSSGILNAVGLQNPGVEYFLENELLYLEQLDTVVIANIAGKTEAEYCKLASKLSETSIDMIELNISCPNVRQGGMAFGVLPENVFKITKMVKDASKKPLIVKLTPNTAFIAENAKAAEEGGADALSLINTITAMAVDIKTKEPVLANKFGGLSGPCVKPIALRMVYDAYKAVKIPIIGIGGIRNETDVIEFMLCGARAVQVGTANISNPLACKEIIESLEKYLVENGIEDVNSLVGALKA